MSASCQHQTLAHSAVAHVQRCSDCGCVSIHLGPTTVRVDSGALETLTATLQEALRVLRGPLEMDPSPDLPALLGSVKRPRGTA